MPVTIKRKKDQQTTFWKKKKKKSDLFQKTEFDISCKLSPVCMKCQHCFQKKKKKKKKKNQIVVCWICPERGKG